MLDSSTPIVANDSEPSIRDDIDEILTGLRQTPKRLSPKYFYDQHGSELFDQICDLPEYYLTRAEFEILREYGDEIAAEIGPSASIIEFGSGASTKIRLLLEHLDAPAVYVPVDISGEYIGAIARELQSDYRDFEVLPVHADFTQPFELPSPKVMPLRNVVFFPGSTIGNFTPAEARSLLGVMRGVAREGGGLLIGVDLVKETEVLEAAYNDAQGVTAAFNRNALVRLNRELGADFAIERFRHRALFNREESRIEMHLIASEAQDVRIGDATVAFAQGESLVTEYSHKYGLEQFAAMAREAGFERRRVWRDSKGLFSVQFFEVAGE
ncbi:L-histidine N(alpha)-methyltransferase [Haliangium ochraceum]|uniref:Methyltransferase n=1 Tax=Haliangium ochraceum (strain DSM 14365 / JCM 11303 / SMP-2) TaxID=502025 RepID=D0LL96_HALO1|nr:L-histidine N(alpha)-methyltransferase [Haliangium ochraceum]ACY18592.1 methyltransferase [Haliangium ochraceum DSM 14365]